MKKANQSFNQAVRPYLNACLGGSSSLRTDERFFTSPSRSSNHPFNDSGRNKFPCPQTNSHRILSRKVLPTDMKIAFLRPSPTLALAAVALMQAACAEQGPPQGHVQGHMLNARSSLNSARDELSQASHDKGGHRVKAIGLINQAIEQVNAGIAVGESHGD
jgi:hypothetical protein